LFFIQTNEIEVTRKQKAYVYLCALSG